MSDTDTKPDDLTYKQKSQINALARNCLSRLKEGNVKIIALSLYDAVCGLQGIGGADYACSHPILKLYTAKFLELTQSGSMDTATLNTAQEQVAELARVKLYNCVVCGYLHPWDWIGDCRDIDTRYEDKLEYAEFHDVSILDIEVASMEDRLLADEADSLRQR